MSRLPGEPSANIRKRVRKARELQNARFSGSKIYCNAQMTSRHMKVVSRFNPEAEAMLDQGVGRLRISARASDRILKLSRSIADLGRLDEIGMEHLSEALQSRGLDREY